MVFLPIVKRRDQGGGADDFFNAWNGLALFMVVRGEASVVVTIWSSIRFL